MDIKTDHQIVAFGDDKMMLFDSSTGVTIVTAELVGGAWTIHAAGTADATAVGREAAVTALTEHALLVLPGTGYSTMCPNAIWDLP